MKQTLPTINEKTYRFDPGFFTIPDNVNLIGSFESEKYFAHIREDVRREYSFRPEILAYARAFLEDLPRKPVVCVHVRRGDFVHLQQDFTVLTMESYYDLALSLIAGQDFTLVLFSDDFATARPMFERYGEVACCEKNHAVSLAVMSLCKYHVIANSTFAWWGAWLNPAPDKIVIAPRDWLGPRRRHLGSEDVYCDGSSCNASQRCGKLCSHSSTHNLTSIGPFECFTGWRISHFTYGIRRSFVTPQRVSRPAFS